jgi:hypothetical protein
MNSGTNQYGFSDMAMKFTSGNTLYFLISYKNNDICDQGGDDIDEPELTDITFTVTQIS